jgi:predicted DNA-binding transcriptional regulator YafY
MKMNRLFEIVYLLIDQEKATARELSNRFEVSTRTIYRDVEDLSAAGVPIYMSKGKNGGISLLPEYVLNKTVLTEEEKNNILSALQSLNVLDASSMENTLSKLSSFFGGKNQGCYEIDFNDWEHLIKDQFEKSKNAIVSKKLLSFDYLSSLNKRSKRTVEPYRLWFKDKNWYLKAFCLFKNDMRTFRFSRMRNVKILEESFVPRSIDFLKVDESKNIYPTIEILMRVDAVLEYRVLDEFLEKDVFQNEDGSFIVRMNTIEDEWLYGYILSFGSNGKVISPPQLIKTIKEIVNRMMNNYSVDVE